MNLKAFLWKYIAGPVVADAKGLEEAVWKGVASQKGYNFYNTSAWAFLAAVFVFLAHRFFKKYEIEFGVKTVIYSTPFILLGGTLRFIEDTGTLPFEVSLILITPVIYFVVGFIYFSSLFASIKVSERYGVERNRVLLYLGQALLIPALVYALYLVSRLRFSPEILIGTLLISLFLFGAYYFLVQDGVFDRKGYHLAVFSQLFGGTASMIAVTQGYEQKQLLAQYATKILGFPGILVFKAGLAGFALYVLKDVEDEEVEALVLLVLAVIGLATGLRVLLRTTAGI